MKMLPFDKICAVAAAPDTKSMRAQVESALHETRTIELRLDWLSSDAEIRRFLAWLASYAQARRPGVSLIATCRRRAAGGLYSGTIAKELLHLAEAIAAGCRWYDLAIESAAKCPPELLDVLLGEGRQITSAHFFKRMPPRLAAVAAQLYRAPHAPASGAIKIAAHCDSLADARKLLSFVRTRRNAIAIPMGDVALSARILALREKRAMAYAPVESATAPGQVSLDELAKVYRAQRINRRTQIYGVIGNPIGHSLSPVMQNAAFAARRVNAVLLPFLVRDLKDFVSSIEPFAIRGFCVTIPHKESIINFLDGCDALAAEIGAVNTVVVRPGGKLYGYDTDYVGVLRAIESRLSLAHSRVLVLGAGGVARAVAFALARGGARVCVTSRRPARAKALAKVAGGEAIPRAQLRGEFFDAIVNATPVGMHPHAGASRSTRKN